MSKYNYKELKGTDLVSDSFKQINDNTNALLAGFEGASFPEKPAKGQRCFMQDAWHTYNGEKWLADAELHNHDSSYYTKIEMGKVMQEKLPPVSDDVNEPTEGAVPTNAAVINFVNGHATIVAAEEFFAEDGGLAALQEQMTKIASGVAEGTIGSVKTVSPVKGTSPTQTFPFGAQAYQVAPGITFTVQGSGLNYTTYATAANYTYTVPAGGSWTEMATGKVYAGGAKIVNNPTITAVGSLGLGLTAASSAVKTFIKVA